MEHLKAELFQVPAQKSLVFCIFCPLVREPKHPQKTLRMACDCEDASKSSSLGPVDGDAVSLRSQDCTMEMARHFPNATFHAYEAPVSVKGRISGEVFKKSKKLFSGLPFQEEKYA